MPYYIEIQSYEDIDRLYRELAGRIEQCCYVIVWEDEGKKSSELTKAEALQYLQDLHIYYHLKHRG